MFLMDYSTNCQLKHSSKQLELNILPDTPTSLYLCIENNLCMYVRMCMYVCMYVRMHACTVCMYVRTYTCNACMH